MKLKISASLETLRAFEKIPDLYLILSPELTVLTASDEYLKATYKERKHIQGKHVFEVFPDNPALVSLDATTNLRSSLERVLKNKKTDKMPIQRYDVPNSIFNLDVYEEKYWLPTNTPFWMKKEILNTSSIKSWM